MKRIGIFSLYYKNYNCGGQLQAYALCKKLSELGYSAEQVRLGFNQFSCEEKGFKRIVKKIRNNLSFRVVYKKIKFEIKQRERVKAINKYVPTILSDREKSYSFFSEQLVPHSEKIYVEKTVNGCELNYDAIVVGSDQVWYNTNKGSVYLCDFLSEKYPRISYAASISRNDLTKKDKKVLLDSLKKFNAVSVREEKTAEILTQIGVSDVECVLDPTLLLDKDDWDAVCAKRYYDGKYLFCYFLGDDLRQRKIAQQVAKEKGLKLVTFVHLANCYVKSDVGFGDVQIYNVSPELFLSLIKYAEFVITDSFHASVFSYIYQREFVAFSRKGHKGMNVRLHTLMNMLESEERFCETKTKEDVDYIINLSPIDYTKARVKLIKQKEKSIEFLKGNIERIDEKRNQSN